MSARDLEHWSNEEPGSHLIADFNIEKPEKKSWLNWGNGSIHETIYGETSQRREHLFDWEGDSLDWETQSTEAMRKIETWAHLANRTGGRNLHDGKSWVVVISTKMICEPDGWGGRGRASQWEE